ncbi:MULTISPECIES: PH domain-containing protein [Winogradskyella]|uniref:PH domain-containing protein n=1 Tax=Winogradskyella TaxID=286104 RepID=UPI0015CC05B1|nr:MULTISPECIES: PH domain-containing protein [Winogradskyella]QXP79654.1 PH domain-containing protein [Winogradskyella sp. HaHa_3_26]
MKFESKKDMLFSVIILGLNAFFITIIVIGLINGEIKQQEYWPLIVIFGVVILIFWLFFGTNYKLTKQDGLIYKCGPLKGQIKIEDITQIIKGKTLWVGLKPATSRNGLIIKYNKYDEIYISPKTNETFIKKILKLNSNIKITE